MTRKTNEKAMKIIRILRKQYPQRKRGEVTSARSRKPFEVLVSAIISQRTKDETTARVASELFKKARTPKKMVAIGKREIAKTIRPANYYKTKADRIHRIAKILANDYGGRVPKTREELMKLPGVGGKTADIVMMVSHGEGVIPVDTHVEVVSQRLGWTKEKTAEKIRSDLHRLFPPRTRGYVNILLVEFGKEFCRKHRPRCGVCPIEKLCLYQKKNL